MKLRFFDFVAENYRHSLCGSLFADSTILHAMMQMDKSASDLCKLLQAFSVLLTVACLAMLTTNIGSLWMFLFKQQLTHLQ